MNIADRAKGCLVGGALGDCLGAPYENQRPPDTFTHPGRWSTTDDTQLTVVTARSIARAGRVDPAALAAALSDEFRRGKLRGLGASTRKALSDLAAGAHWALAGRKGEMAAGNGAAMRIAPLAFVLDAASDQDRRTIRDVCRITHHNEEAYVAALAIVAAIQVEIRGGFSHARLTASVASVIPDSLTRDRLLELAELSEETEIAEVADRFGTSGHAPESVPLAIFAAETARKRPIMGVLEAIIMQGGDTDTNAALAGQIAGAALGLSGLPSEVVENVPGLDDLRRLGDGLGARYRAAP